MVPLGASCRSDAGRHGISSSGVCDIAGGFRIRVRHRRTLQVSLTRRENGRDRDRAGFQAIALLRMRRLIRPTNSAVFFLVRERPLLGLWRSADLAPYPMVAAMRAQTLCSEALLNDSTNALSVGSPGRLKARVTSRRQAHLRRRTVLRGRKLRAAWAIVIRRPVSQPHDGNLA